MNGFLDTLKNRYDQAYTTCGQYYTSTKTAGGEYYVSAKDATGRYCVIARDASANWWDNNEDTVKSYLTSAGGFVGKVAGGLYESTAGVREYSRAAGIVPGAIIATVCAVAIAIFFDLSTVKTAAICGFVNFIVLAVVGDTVQESFKFESAAAPVLMGVTLLCAVVSQAILKKCGMPLENDVAFPLAAAAFVGNILKHKFREDADDN